MSRPAPSGRAAARSEGVGSRTQIQCAYCGKLRLKQTGAVNRANSIGAPLYCDRTCSGLGRRCGKTKAQKVAEKRAYDADYRRKNQKLLKIKKAVYHKDAYDPKSAAKKRKERAPYHLEYCRRPEYRAWKRGYDRQLRASEFLQYADAYLLLLDLEREIAVRATKYERMLENGTLNKAQQRKRAYRAQTAFGG